MITIYCSRQIIPRTLVLNVLVWKPAWAVWKYRFTDKAKFLLAVHQELACRINEAISAGPSPDLCQDLLDETSSGKSPIE